MPIRTTPAIQSNRHRGRNRGGDALAALEAEEDRKAVTAEGARKQSTRDQLIDFEPTRDQYRNQALQTIAEQREKGRLFAGDPQHVGSARVLEPSLRGSGSPMILESRIADEIEPSR